jgi:hypothetical protein
MEPDEESDFWADHPQDAIESDEYRRLYPEAFAWTCCQRVGDEEGCTLDVHVPDTGKRRKAAE